MRTRTYRIPATLGVLLLLVTISACEGAQLPQLVHPQAALPRLPISVALDFDESVKSSRIEADACGSTWEGHLGHALATSFIRTSQESFRQVQTTDGTGPTPEPHSDLQIRLFLEQHAFEPKTAIGAEDNYTARFNIDMYAVVMDPRGNPIGKAPLSYDERVNIWTPQIGGGSSSCETGQLEGAMHNAADDLARQMVASVAQWAAGPPQSGAPVPGAAAPTARPQGGPPAQLVMKATLLDENDNVILEGGEKIGVRVDVQNTGATPVASSTVTLSGTSALIDAFSTVSTGAITMGPIQPAESKSTIVWGKMPDEVKPGRGELVVSVLAGGSSTSQTLVAAIRPGVASGAQGTILPTPPMTDPMTHQGAPPQAARSRHAVLVNVGRYRTPFAAATADRSGSFPHLVRTLRTVGGLSRNEMLVLTDRGATRADFEHGFLKWLPSKIGADSVVLVYVSTMAVADGQSGEVYLIPYDGTPATTDRTLVSLHALQGTLKRLHAKLCLLLIDAPLTSAGDAPRKLDWRGVLPPSGRASTRLVQVVAGKGSRPLDDLLVRALGGQADTNQDTHVTVGELLDYLKTATEIYPDLPASAPERAIPLTG